MTLVADAARRAKPGDWIVGRGWHQEKWDRTPAPSVEGFPTHASLDRVSPGHPEASYIILKLRGDPSITGERMPLGGPYLPSAEIDGIAAWIRAGAPRN